jgi:hypothetical protein
MSKFVEPLVQSPPGLTDIHQEIFSGRPDPVEAGLFGDLPEFVSVCGERDPWDPREVAPISVKIFHLSTSELMELSGFCWIDPLVLEDNRVLLSLCNEFENITGIYFEGFNNFRRNRKIKRIAAMMKPGLHRIFHFCHASRSANAHLALNAHYVH